MSSKIKDTNKNGLVSNSNINVIEIKKEVSNKQIDEKEYINFCNKYSEVNFEEYKVNDLKFICRNGNGLLDQYFILNDKDPKAFRDKSIITKLEHIVNLAVYTLVNKQNEELHKQNTALNKKLTENIKEAQKIKGNAQKESEEIETIKNDMKSITTTIISIILTISIIPTAIVGIEKMSGEYILPFISTVILFGMVMIVFIYSIYQNKLKISTWVILIVMFIFTVVLWWNCIKKVINITNNDEIEEMDAIETIEESKD